MKLLTVWDSLEKIEHLVIIRKIVDFIIIYSKRIVTFDFNLFSKRIII